MQPLNDILKEKHPFVLYRSPKSDKLCYMRIGNAKRLDVSLQKLTNNGFIFAPFKSTEKYPAYLFEPAQTATYDINQKIEIQAEVLYMADSDFKSTSREKYGRKFQQFAHFLKQQPALRKLVLARKFFLGSEIPVDAGEILYRLHKAFPGSFLFLVNHPQTGVWCGVTPESLFFATAESGSTVALAGTQKIEELSPMHWTEKEIEEHHLVEIFIEQKLNEQIGSFEKEGPYTVFTGNLAHLKTTYHFDITPAHIVPLIRQLHPTPAVSGLPKAESQKIITETEGFEREYYAGYLGMISPDGSGLTDLFVTLRCFKICKQGMEFFIGGGITQQSDEEKEWVETENKLESLLPFVC
jgi:isochorismate synthase